MKDYEIYDGSMLVGLVNMNEKKKETLYTIVSVIALIIVIVGIVVAFINYKNI